ncbi:MAG: methylated-DNA--[protein]-cysteine S-methyltransferase [Pirellulales bacterium]
MQISTYYDEIDSPLGRILLFGDGEFLTGLYTLRHKNRPPIGDSWRRETRPFVKVREQLAEYFAGERQVFDVPLKLHGTPFQQQVWRELVRIQFGATSTYGELARRLKRPTASRAVGAANGQNPISIIVPCHRVIGSSGSLTGYAGGIDMKRELLQHERVGCPTLFHDV